MHIAKVCEEKSKFSEAEAEYFNVPEFRLIYCDIPKAASTTWKYILSESTKASKNLTQFPYFPHDTEELQKRGVIKTSEVTKEIKNFTKFVAVRHPVARVLSAYSDFFAKDLRPTSHHTLHGSYRLKIRRDLRKSLGHNVLNINEAVKIEDFVHYVVKERQNENRMNRHWETQSSLCDPCHNRYVRAILSR